MTTAAQDLYPIISYDEANLEVKEIYDDTMRTLQLPFVLNWFKHQGSYPDMLKANWFKLKHTLMEGVVPNVLKQLIIYNISSKRGCDYCADAHGIFANSMADQISSEIDFSLKDNLNHELVPNSYRTAIEVVTKAALDSQNMAPSDYKTLQDAGFSSEEVVELLSQADLANMLNTIAYISGTRLDNELMEAKV